MGINALKCVTCDAVTTNRCEDCGAALCEKDKDNCVECDDELDEDEDDADPAETDDDDDDDAADGCPRCGYSWANCECDDDFSDNEDDADRYGSLHRPRRDDN